VAVDPITARIRALNRTADLIVYRASTPSTGNDFFVQRQGGPDGKTTNGIQITNLRMEFTVHRDLSKHPNRSDVKIYNLAPVTRAAVETKPLSVDFTAGYDGVNRLVVAGDVLFAMSKQEGPNWVTMLQVGDGARAFGNARVTPRSYPGSTSVKSIVRDIAKSMGQTLPLNIEQSRTLNAQVPIGSVISGPAQIELSRLLAPYGFDWSFQNGRLQILRDTDVRTDVLPIGEKYGMLGTPEFGQPKKNGKPPTMTVKNLLYPELVPGGQVDLQTTTIRGRFKVVKVKHNGDTHGDQWFTEIEIKPL